MFCSPKNLKESCQSGTEIACKWIQQLMPISFSLHLLYQFGSLIEEILRNGGLEVGGKHLRCI